VTYYVALKPAPDRYTSIYLLDSNGKAVDYPAYVVSGVNSTFNVYVDVENHLGSTLTDAQVQVKITSQTNPTFPLDVNATDTFTGTVKDGATWQNLATVSLTQPGNYFVVFELWIPNGNGNGQQFSGQYATLSVQVAAS